jgi:hypothetical protein
VQAVTALTKKMASTPAAVRLHTALLCAARQIPATVSRAVVAATLSSVSAAPPPLLALTQLGVAGFQLWPGW